MLLLVFYHNEQENNLNCDAIFSCDIRQLDMLVSVCGILFAKKIYGITVRILSHLVCGWQWITWRSHEIVQNLERLSTFTLEYSYCFCFNI